MNKLLKEFISYILTEESLAKTTMLTFVDKQGKSQTKSALTLSRYPKGSNGRKAYDSWKASQPKNAQAKATTSSKDKKVQKTSTKQPKTDTTPDGSTPTIPGVPQSAVVPMTNAPGNIPAKPIEPTAAKADKKKYDELMSAIKDGKIQFLDSEQQKRAEGFMRLWQAFVSAPTYEEQVKGIQALIDNGMIEGGGGGKKIYIADTVGLPYKGMCGDGGTKVTELMNKIIQDEGIDLPPRAGSGASKQAAESGPTNEAGVTALLDPSDDNNKKYEEAKRRYAAVGGDTEEIDRLNRGAAEAIKQSLPPGAKITKAVQVGGSKELQKKYGITDQRIDPTDVILEYELDGKTVIKKISAKIYANPNVITMKNAGLTDAGATYIGEPGGSAVDEIYSRLRKDPALDWTAPGLNEKEIKDRKNKFRQQYTEEFSKKMEELASDSNPNSEGQQRLSEMWKKVHGCGQNVSTLIVNKNTGKSELKDPDYYCSPKLPFKVKYNGTKVVIEMDTAGPQTLEINLKTETSGAAKLLFNHVVRKSKK
jgi:hypothetical protein